MSKHQDQVLELLRQGLGAIAVQEDDFRSYMAAFQASDPAGAPEPRPVLTWDTEDGFVPPVGYPEDLPTTIDLVEALEFVLTYRGEAVFVLDCRNVDWTQGEARLRRTLKQLSMKLVNKPSTIALFVVAQSFPTSLAERVTWIGEETSAESARGAPAAEAAPAKPSQTEEYRDLRDLRRFDTPEWELRLNSMTPEEVDKLISCGAYRDPLERIRELRTSLKGRFARKDAVVDALCAAAIAQVPTVLIGPPGTAKSNLIRAFCEGLGLTAHHQEDSAGSDGLGSGRRYFEYLLTRYTTPEEIFGPIHVQDLIDRQTYRRVTAGYLPQAQISFLDEIFKASSAILNTLLTLLNERLFYNGGRAERVPLMMVFAASNEAPVDENLQALYDRFPLRLDCPSVADEHVGELLNCAWQQAYDRQFSAQQLSLRSCACTNDLRLLRHVIRVRFGGRSPGERGRGQFDFEQEFLRFFRSLRTDFSISDRTLSLLLGYCRAQALLNNQSELTSAELDVFKLVAWDDAGTGELERLVNNMKRGINR
ncbi:MAG: AAA family ATPase [Planctomycetota bacterium]|nr:AAA family ATPase [Planctomycetota bacterium]